MGQSLSFLNSVDKGDIFLVSEVTGTLNSLEVDDEDDFLGAEETRDLSASEVVDGSDKVDGENGGTGEGEMENDEGYEIDSGDYHYMAL